MTLVLKLYVAGRSGVSIRAESNLRRLVEQMEDDVEICVVDVLNSPELAEEDHVLATPTLVRSSPLPQRKVIGDLSQQDLVLAYITD